MMTVSTCADVFVIEVVHYVMATSKDILFIQESS